LLLLVAVGNDVSFFGFGLKVTRRELAGFEVVATGGGSGSE
jgi:hypothetical protein